MFLMTVIVERSIAWFLAASLLAVPVVQAAPADPQRSLAQPITGCSWAPSGPGAEGRVAQASVVDEDDDDDNEDDVDEQEEDEPRIVGSVPAPPGVRKNDQRALSRVATITRDEAVRIALGAIPDADQRRLGDVDLEIEQGYVVWEVETVLRSRAPHPDKYAEVVVDAGNGNILFIECEAEDD